MSLRAMAPAVSGFHGLAFLRGWDDRGRTASGDGVVALAGVESTVRCDAGDVLAGRDLVEQFRQHGRIAHVAGGELGDPDFQRLLVNPNVDLASDAALGAAMLAGVQARRQWRKVHPAMDTATSGIRAVELTPSGEGDSPILPELLDQIPGEEDIGTVTADGAHVTRRCHSAIIARRHGDDPDLQERSPVERGLPGRQAARQNPLRYASL
jgi:hypothetical protein